MNIYEAFPSKYLKAADLGGKEWTLTVQTVRMENVVEGETKPVLYFEGASKGLVLNRTNADNISIVYGEETGGWIGKKVILYPDTVLFQGRRTPCLRVRPAQQDISGEQQLPPQQPAPQQPSAQQPVDHSLDDSIPFAPLRELP